MRPNAAILFLSAIVVMMAMMILVLSRPMIISITSPAPVLVPMYVEPQPSMFPSPRIPPPMSRPFITDLVYLEPKTEFESEVELVPPPPKEGQIAEPLLVDDWIGPAPPPPLVLEDEISKDFNLKKNQGFVIVLEGKEWNFIMMLRRRNLNE